MANSSPRNKTRKSTLRLNVEAMITAFILAMVIRTFVICPFKIPSSSMYPTLVGDPRKGDKILVNKFRYLWQDPQRSDIVVFKTRGIEGLDPDKDYIKRLVALPGEKIYIKNNRLYINGERITEPSYLAKKRYVFHGSMKWGDPENPLVVPEDHYFVMGDNTENSRDSRYFGCVPGKNISGRAFLVYWPFKRMGKLH